MNAIDSLPFGAESPDELLAAYANGSLDPSARHEVERWLAVHPEWQPRLDLYQSIAGAVRQAAQASDPPEIAALAGVWSAIDAQAQPRPLRAPVPPPPPTAAPRDRHRSGWRSSPLLLALAATLLVAVAAAGVLLSVTRGGGGDVAVLGVDPDEPDTAATAPTAGEDDDEEEPATSAPPATGGATAGDAAQALRDGAEATARQQTARSSVNAVGTLDLTGTSAADVAGADIVTVTITGTGDIQFPDRARLDTETTIEGGVFTGPDETTSTIEVDGRVWVSCNAGAYVEQLEGQEEPECTALDLGADLAGPDATLDLLDAAEGTIEKLGTEPINGVDTEHYRFESSFEDDEAGTTPMTVDVWLGAEDDLLYQLTATAEFTMPLDLLGESMQIPARLVLQVNLDDFGAPVSIEPPA